MKRHPPDPAALLRQGLALGMHDLAAGRAELRAAAAGFEAGGDVAGQVLACAAQVLFIGVADDDYTGFEAAVAMLAAAGATPFADAADALLAEAGLLMAGSFNALDAADLAVRAARIESAMVDDTVPAAWRCACALAALNYRHIGMQLEQVLWLELALRPLLSEAATTIATTATAATVSPRLADEAAHLLVQALYQCEAPARALALRQHHFAAGRVLPPAIALKLALLDAQMVLGAGDADAGRRTLAGAEPLLDPRAPRPAGWWHLLRSRLELLDGHHRQALTHARLALRLATESQIPERWMGVTVMQEGQVLVARGQPLAAVPFFERAGRAASGSQARFCQVLVCLARALHHFDHADTEPGCSQLTFGLAGARELAWLNFFRASPAVAARLCALALEHGIEAAFAREVIAERRLPAQRADLEAWPWPIRVRTFGGLRIELQGRPLVFRGKVAKKPLELLLFVVACHGTDVPLATLCFALWPELEGDKARAAATAALHRLRKLLGNDEALRLEHGRLSLNPQQLWVDCLAFEQLADAVPTAGVLDAQQQANAERACALYSGAFLHDGQDSAWQLSHRTRLASKCNRLLRLLATAAGSRGDSAAARGWLEKGLEADPLAEDLARELMREHIERGEPAAALRVLERLRAELAQRLATPPAAATLALVELGVPLLPPEGDR